jgi:RNA recognition motif-containing protein
MNIYVGNLPYNMHDDDLRATFAEFGEVTSASIVMDRMTNQSKGFGFVEMPRNADADKAIKALNEKPIGGRMLKVNQAKPREQRAPRRF